MNWKGTKVLGMVRQKGRYEVRISDVEIKQIDKMKYLA